MKYVLFVMACLSHEPDQCIGEPIDLPEVKNATACHLASRLRMHEWAEAHPDMEIKEAKCMGRPLNMAGTKTAF